MTDYNQITGDTKLQFAIEAGVLMIPCTVITKGVDAGEVNVGSFHSEKCVESDYLVSWDYSALTDVAMLTVVQ